MPINSIIYAGQTLLSLAEDTLNSAAQLLKGTTAHSNDGTPLEGTARNVIQAKGISVAVSDWISDTTYADYPYKAAVAVPGVTEDYTPYVIFSPAAADSRILCRFSNTYNGGTFIYATEIPNEALSIEKMEFIQE